MKNTTKYVRNCPKCGKEISYTTEKILMVSTKKNKMCRSCSMEKRYSNLEERKKASIIHKKSYFNNPSIKEKLSTSGIKRYSNPIERKRTGVATKKALENPIIRKKISDANIKRFSNPEELKKMTNDVKIAMNKSEFRKKHSYLIKLALHRPDIRKKHIEALSKVNYLGRAADVGQRELLEKWNELGFNFEPNFQVKTDQDLFYLDGYDKEKNVILEYDSKYHNSRHQREKDLVRQQKIIDILNPKKFWRYNATNKQFKNVLERR